MITPTSTDTKLSIILTSTNRALAEAVKNASPEQLNRLQEGKDIKSLLSDVFHDKLTSSKSDRVLMDILSNAPAFKNMGNFTDNLQTLLSRLKESGSFEGKLSALETFVRNAKEYDGTILKKQVGNSGVFMESKIAAAVNSVQTLTQTLEGLRALLSQSALPGAKTIEQALNAILSGNDLKQAAQDPLHAAKVTNALQNVTDAYRSLSAKTDPLYSIRVTDSLQTLERLLSGPVLSSGDIKTMQATLSSLYATLLGSTAPDANRFLDTIESLLKSLNTGDVPSEKISEHQSFLRELHAAIVNKDPALSAHASAFVSRMGEFLRPGDLLIDDLLKAAVGEDLKSQLMALSDDIQKNPLHPATDLLDSVNRLLTQIDYHQLLSHLNAANSIYLPFSWDQMEEGTLSFKKNREKKFYCEIRLKLKEYGALDLMMSLQDDNQIEIQAHTEQKALQELLQENLPMLRSLLIDAGLSPRRIRIFGSDESLRGASGSYGSNPAGPDLGFEVTV